MTEEIRILVVDDHAIVREGLSLILETNPQMVVVGEAENGRQALEQIDECRPDVVLLDLRMPEMDGLATLHRLQEDFPHIAVVILTTYNEDRMMLQALQAGARGYLLKDTDRGTLMATIGSAARGDTLIGPDVLARALAAANHDTSPGSSSGKESAGIELTDRELAVLRSAARGERSKEIARHLHVSERTVKAHLTSVYNKLGVDSRAEAVAVAMRAGWI